jgi:hypothetical protein
VSGKDELQIRSLSATQIVTLECVEQAAKAIKADGTDTWSDLSSICRKIDVEKKLRREYAPCWKRLESAALLTCEEWNRFCATWALIIASIPSDDSGKNARRLKLINTGLKAIDLWEAECGDSEAVSHSRNIMIRYLEDFVSE